MLKNASMVACLFLSMQPLELAQLHAAAHDMVGVSSNAGPSSCWSMNNLNSGKNNLFPVEVWYLRLLPDHHQLLLGSLQLTPINFSEPLALSP